MYNLLIAICGILLISVPVFGTVLYLILLRLEALEELTEMRKHDA